MFNVLNQVLNGLANMPNAMGVPTNFKRMVRCYPVAFVKESLEAGDKILLPVSALDELTRMRITYPMMFSIKNPATLIKTHCGVMEFSAAEGTAYLPFWMMEHLGVEAGSYIEIENVSLPKGSFVKFRPHAMKFTELSNPRVVLETALRNFSCLTTGDTIKIVVDSIPYYLDVTETKPAQAVSIIETDMQVDFEAPRDMAAHEALTKAKTALAAASAKSTASTGAGGAAGSPVPEFKIPSASSATPAPSSSNGPAGAASTGAGSSSYFANLKSTGYTLKGKRPAPSTSQSPSPSPAVPSKTPAAIGGTPLSSSTGKGNVLSASSSQSRLAGSATPVPMQTSSSPAPAAAADSGPAVPVVERQVVEQGQWRYIYEFDKVTKKQRLVKREAITDKPKTFTPFGGSGNVLGASGR